MSADRSYMLDDDELAEVSIAYASEKLTLVSTSPMKSGDVTLRVSDGAWVYVVRVTPSGDWTWGFKYEA